MEEVRRDAISSAEKREWAEIEITFDSGATDPVMPISMCESIAIQPSQQSIRGTEYEVASREAIPNVGVRRRMVMTEGSNKPNLMNFQACDVHKPLLSATKVCDMNYRCILEREGGYLEDREDGEKIPLHRRGNLYVMKLWVKAAGFSRQG